MDGRFDVSGRAAFVTGASRGIGRAIALALAEHGADVAINHTSAFDAEVGFRTPRRRSSTKRGPMAREPSRSRAISRSTVPSSTHTTGRSRRWGASISW